MTNFENQTYVPLRQHEMRRQGEQQRLLNAAHHPARRRILGSVLGVIGAMLSRLGNALQEYNTYPLDMSETISDSFVETTQQQ